MATQLLIGPSWAILLDDDADLVIASCYWCIRMFTIASSWPSCKSFVSEDEHIPNFLVKVLVAIENSLHEQKHELKKLNFERANFDF